MVCNRCIFVVKQVLDSLDINYINVDLKGFFLKNKLSNEGVALLSQKLMTAGFEIITKQNDKIVNQIKILIIQEIHQKLHSKSIKKITFFLSNEIGVSYSKLSKLFSNTENRTIEKFIILQKIERAKELLSYNEMTLSQISYDLDYSSPQHLSRQFKKTTGITPTYFKKNGVRNKLDTI